MISIDDTIGYADRLIPPTCFLLIAVALIQPSIPHASYTAYVSGVAIITYLVVKAVQHINTKYVRRGSWPGVEGQSAIVTGASRGLGLEIAKNLIRKGCTVYNLDVEESSYTHERMHYVKCDLNIREELEHALETIQANKVAIVVNNAGVRHSESLMDLSDEQIQRLFNINTFSSIWINRRIVRARKEPVFIVTVSSVLGVLAPRNLSIYAATKAANIAIHEAMSQELPTHRLLLVLPGQLNTQMFENIDASNPFLAPVVDHKVLAREIADKIDRGERGVIYRPVYANFLPGIRVLPQIFQDLARWVSGMDEKIH